MAASLPNSYSEMYPGRFLKADMLKGRKVSLTIKDIEGDDLIGENNKTKSEWLVKFEERKLEFVLNKTNAYCLYRMFGGDPHTWIGHQITIYPTQTKFGKQDMDCIRIWGSPDITEDMPITVPQGRKKAWETIMHRVSSSATTNGSSSPAAAIDPRMMAAYDLLDWNGDERAKDRAAFIGSDAEYIKRLNGLVDEKSANES